MKKSTVILGILTLLLSVGFITSCGNKEKEKANEILGKMEMIIPEELEDNPELVAFIKGMTEVVDQYALLIDDVLEDIGEFAGKDIDDLNMAEKIKLTAAGAEVAMKSAPIMVKWAELENERTLFYDDLDDSEILALETLMDRFEKRIEQIEARHMEIFGSDTE